MRLLALQTQGERGFTLIELLVAVASSALVFWAVSSFSVNIAKFVENALMSNDIIEMRDYLVSNYDCELTLEGAQRTSCQNNESIEVRRDRIGARPLIVALNNPGGATRVGKLAIHAKCEPCKNKNCPGGRVVKVYYTRIEQPISDSEWRFADYNKMVWKDLLEGMDLGCSL